MMIKKYKTLPIKKRNVYFFGTNKLKIELDILIGAGLWASRSLAGGDYFLI